MQQFAHAVGLLDTRHFNHDAAHLAFEALDVGLGYAELVDTGTDDVVGIVNGRLHFGAEHFLHLAVGAVGSHFAFQLLGGEDGAELVFAGQFLIAFNKQCDKVTLALLGLSCCFVYGLIELGIFRVVGQCADDIGNRHFQNHVHTAFKVKAQAYLLGLTLFEGLAHPNGFVLQRIQIELAGLGFHLSCFFLIVTAHE